LPHQRKTIKANGFEERSGKLEKGGHGLQSEDHLIKNDEVKQLFLLPEIFSIKKSKAD
jgi:hypothetical protein